MSSNDQPIQLPAGSIWFETKPKKEILVLTPYRNNPYRYSINGRQVGVHKIEKNFSDPESFYFWAAQTMRQELTSAYIFKSQSNRILHKFYRNILKPETHFERCETTISHLFRFRHPALGNLSYGMKFFECLEKKKCIPQSGAILEIGAGLGGHTRDFIASLKDKVGVGFIRPDYGLNPDPRLHSVGIPTAKRIIKGRDKLSPYYVNVDLSLKMLKTQEKINCALGRRHFFAQTDGQKLPFKRQSLDLVIANEVIADLSVVKLTRAKAKRFPLLRKYHINVDDAPKEFLINSGAIGFLEELWRILRPGGSAVIVEYGDEWAYPVASPLKGHTEYSIHFGHLIQAAKELGFKVEYQNLFDFMRFSPSVKVITGNSFVLLRRLMKYLGKDLPYFAYTEQMLAQKIGRLYPRIHNLQFESLKKLAVLFRAQEFKVLLLEK